VQRPRRCIRPCSRDPAGFVLVAVGCHRIVAWLAAAGRPLAVDFSLLTPLSRLSDRPAGVGVGRHPVGEEVHLHRGASGEHRHHGAAGWFDVGRCFVDSAWAGNAMSCGCRAVCGSKSASNMAVRPWLFPVERGQKRKKPGLWWHCCHHNPGLVFERFPGSGPPVTYSSVFNFQTI